MVSEIFFIYCSYSVQVPWIEYMQIAASDCLFVVLLYMCKMIKF